MPNQLRTGRRPAAGLPRCVVLTTVQVVGILGMVAGLWMVFRSNALGLGVVLVGRELTVRPAARHPFRLSPALELLAAKRRD